MSEAGMPNLIGLGAPRAGTTTLFGILQGLPDVLTPALKEQNDFGLRDNPDRADYVPALEFAEEFRADRSFRYRCEISPIYLSRKSSLEAIARAVPDASVIACLREPLSRALSDYRRLANRPLGEMDRDLQKAMDRLRRNESIDPDALDDPANCLSRSLYATSLQTCFDLFGRDRVLVLLFEDLGEGVDRWLSPLADFLQVDIPQFDIRSFRNEGNSSLAGLGPAAMAELRAFFADDTARTGDLLGLDLTSRWRVSDGPEPTRAVSSAPIVGADEPAVGFLFIDAAPRQTGAMIQAMNDLGGCHLRLNPTNSRNPENVEDCIAVFTDEMFSEHLVDLSDPSFVPDQAWFAQNDVQTRIDRLAEWFVRAGKHSPILTTRLMAGIGASPAALIGSIVSAFVKARIRCEIVFSIERPRQYHHEVAGQGVDENAATLEYVSMLVRAEIATRGLARWVIPSGGVQGTLANGLSGSLAIAAERVKAGLPSVEAGALAEGVFCSGLAERIYSELAAGARGSISSGAIDEIKREFDRATISARSYYQKLRPILVNHAHSRRRENAQRSEVERLHLSVAEEVARRDAGLRDAAIYTATLEQERASMVEYCRLQEEARASLDDYCRSLERERVNMAEYCRSLEQERATTAEYCRSLEQARAELERYARSLGEALHKAQAIIAQRPGQGVDPA
jgi:hypothetical protein